MTVAADIMSASKLSAAAFDALIDLIVSAFDADTLAMHVKRKIGINLYEVVEQKATLDVQVFQLLTASEREGYTVLLLRSVVDVRPGRRDLRDAIAQHCPAALEAPQSLGVQSQTVVAGVKTMQIQFDESSAVRDVIGASREKLDPLMEKIDILFNYKVLHDCLHTIQLKQYPIIVDKVKQFRTDPLTSADLETDILELKDICSDARKAAEALPDEAAARAQQLQWVGTLESAIAELRKGVDDLDDLSVTRAVRFIRRVIRQEPFRVNALLIFVADTLPLEELAQTIEKVISAAVAEGGVPASELKNALHSLRNNILPQLRGRVAEHKQWQEVENDFWEAEDCIERRTSDSIEEFSELWPDTKSRVESLALTEPESDWAKATKKQASLIDADVARHVDSAMEKFEYFRKTALFHFYQVDKALKAQCAEILKLRAPLRSLLSKV
jgi:effector-associated domain 1 (EAD1)-containing protein